MNDTEIFLVKSALSGLVDKWNNFTPSNTNPNPKAAELFKYSEFIRTLERFNYANRFDTVSKQIHSEIVQGQLKDFKERMDSIISDSRLKNEPWDRENNPDNILDKFDQLISDVSKMYNELN